VRYGPSYLLLGSRLTDDTYVLRVILEGLNTWGRQWGETLIILGNGSLRDLEQEVEWYRSLEYRRVDQIGKPNIVIAFMDRMSHNRLTENWLREASRRGIPAFVVGTGFSKTP
jgi:hypothetical protein